MVTVYRLTGGARCPFSEPVDWKEAYGRVGGTALPNEMWQKRPQGNCTRLPRRPRCARRFPRRATPPPRRWRGKRSSRRRLLRCRPIIGSRRSRRKTRGRRADQELDHDPETGEVGPRAVERGDNEPWRDWCARLLVHIRKEEEFEPIDEWVKANQAAITALLKDAPKIQCIACGGDRQAPRGNPRAARGNRGRRADAQAM